MEHSEENYVDNENVSHPCRSSAAGDGDNSTGKCKDYLQVYYGDQSRVYCRSELAELDLVLRNVTSFLAIYWTDSTSHEHYTGSFKIRAECV